MPTTLTGRVAADHPQIAMRLSSMSGAQLVQNRKQVVTHSLNRSENCFPNDPTDSSSGFTSGGGQSVAPANQP